MSDASVATAEEDLANQATIIANQKAIKANQETIKKNQASILKNQGLLTTIVGNQKKNSVQVRPTLAELRGNSGRACSMVATTLPGCFCARM